MAIWAILKKVSALLVAVEAFTRIMHGKVRALIVVNGSLGYYIILLLYLNIFYSFFFSVPNEKILERENLNNY